MNTDLNRDAPIRKSIRINTKRMAPAPPLSIDIDNIDGTPVASPSVAMKLTKSPPPTVMPRKSLLTSTNHTTTTYITGNGVSKDNSLLHDTPIVPASKYNPQYRVEIKDKFNLKLSDITPDFDDTTNKFGPDTKITLSKAKNEFFHGADDSSKELSNLQSTINSLILNTNVSPQTTPTDEKMTITSPKMYKKVSERYGEQSNLLNTGISDVASGHGLAFESSQDDVEQPMEFKRGVDGRNSTGGAVAFATKFLSPKPKVVKPVARTSSDSKNMEVTIRNLRAKMKERDLEQKQAQQMQKKKQDGKSLHITHQQTRNTTSTSSHESPPIQMHGSGSSGGKSSDEPNEVQRHSITPQVLSRHNHDMKVLFYIIFHSSTIKTIKYNLTVPISSNDCRVLRHLQIKRWLFRHYNLLIFLILSIQFFFLFSRN